MRTAAIEQSAQLEAQGRHVIVDEERGVHKLCAQQYRCVKQKLCKNKRREIKASDGDHLRNQDSA